MRNTALVLAVAALLAGACAESGPQDVSHPRLDPLEGVVEVFRDGEARQATEPTELESGDVVQTGSGGRALLRFPGSQSVEVAPLAELGVGSSGPELITGSALVKSSTGLSVRVGEISVESRESLYRLDRDVALRVGVYDGGVRLPDTGFEGTVSRLREAVVTAGIVPREPRPLALDPTDVWDTRFLGEAIDLGLDLDRLEAGLSRQIPARKAEATLAEVIPEPLSVNALSVISELSPAGGLVASALAVRVASDLAIPALEALRRIVGEIRLGASWSVVVAQWEVARAALLDGLARISDLVVRALAPPPGQAGSPANGRPARGSSAGSTSGGTTNGSSPGASSSGGSTDGGAAGGTGGSGTGGGGSGGGGSGGGGSGGGGSSGGGSTGPPSGCGNLVQCTVEDLIGEDGLDLVP